jgi:hypothetical protein
MKNVQLSTNELKGGLFQSLLIKAVIMLMLDILMYG